MALGRVTAAVGNVDWGFLLAGAVRYSLLYAGGTILAVYGLSVLTGWSFGLLALVLVFVGIVALTVLANSGPHRHVSAASMDPRTSGTVEADASSIRGVSMAPVSVKFFFFGVGLIVGSVVGLVFFG